MPEVDVPFRSTPRRSSARRAAVLVALLVAAMAPMAGPAQAADGGTSAAAQPQQAAASHFKVLKRGSRGAAVRRLQRKLRIKADGVFGRGTQRAVKRFQRRKRLTADGVVGPATAKALGLTSARETRREASTAAPRDIDATLRKIAMCESGGNPRAISPGGTYRGKYQFSRETWKGLGGKGDPAKAPEAEQDRLARKLLRERGTAPWPSCG